jgi:hypothetical protein
MENAKWKILSLIEPSLAEHPDRQECLFYCNQSASLSILDYYDQV